MKNTGFAVLLLGMCCSCTNPLPGRQGEKPDSLEVAATDTTTRLLKGIYYSKDGRDYLRTCDTTFRLTGDLAGVRQIYAQLDKGLSYPGESVYAELSGATTGNRDIDDMALFVVKSAGPMQSKNFRTPCYEFEFILLGTEPFWSLDIIPGEQRMVFKDASIERVFTFPYVVANRAQNSWHYRTRSEKGELLDIAIRREPCSDGMSDRMYQYSAQLSIGERRFKGCAIRRGDQFPGE